MNKLTQKRNEKFKAATKAERAVMVAKDALNMLNRGKIKAENGTWVNISRDYIKDFEDEIQICDLTDLKDFSCEVCALGSLMLSEIRHTNELKISELIESYLYSIYFIDYDDYGHRLDKVFSKTQQKMMEYAFEGGRGYFEYYYNPKQEKRLYSFYEKYPDETDRLRAILKNVIKNNGKFVV